MCFRQESVAQLSKNLWNSLWILNWCFRQWCWFLRDTVWYKCHYAIVYLYRSCTLSSLIFLAWLRTWLLVIRPSSQCLYESIGTESQQGDLKIIVVSSEIHDVDLVEFVFAHVDDACRHAGCCDIKKFKQEVCAILAVQGVEPKCNFRTLLKFVFEWERILFGLETCWTVLRILPDEERHFGYIILFEPACIDSSYFAAMHTINNVAIRMLPYSFFRIL